MPKPHEISEALLETVQAMVDGCPALEECEFMIGETAPDLPPSADALSQRWLPIDIDGERYAVVAYRVAG